jgi:serine/threonine protein kinase
LKLLRLTNPKKAQRFAREARIHATLSERRAPNIIPLIDHNLAEVEGGAENGYLVMPIAASPLDDVVETLHGRLELCLEIFEGIVNGVAAAHAEQVVHRDLKPANILFRDKSLKEPLISDFGICFLKSDEDRVTSVNETVGARYFMAPEQERGGQVDVTPAADVYALGKMLCFMLTGRLAHREYFDRELDDSSLKDDPRLRIVRERLLAASIVEDPAKRVSDAGKLLAIVREVRQSFKGPGGTGSTPRPTVELRTAFDTYTKAIAREEVKNLALEFDHASADLAAVWRELERSVHDRPDEAESAARRLVASQPRPIVLSLAAARMDEVRLYSSFKKLLENAIKPTDLDAGYPSILAIPQVFAGFVYMATSAMAFKARSWKFLGLLFSNKFAWYYGSGKPLYSYGFDMSYFFHSEAFKRKGDKVHDYFRELIQKDFADLFGVSEKDATDLYVQCQMLMCLRGAQMIQTGEDISMFADFARFYGSRVENVLHQVLGDDAFAAGLASVFKESPEDFLRNLNERWSIIKEHMWKGTGYIWESVREWEIPEDSHRPRPDR